MADPHQLEMPAMILRHLRPAVLSRPIQTHTHFHLSPRLQFTVSHTAAQSATLRVESILRHLAGERFIQREEMVHRILTNGSRQEGDRTPPPRRQFPPAPQTFARGAAPAVPLRSAAPDAASAATPEAQLPRRPTSSLAIPIMAPQPDLDRLSEHVIRTIDRRLQAYRERTGRL